MKRVFSRSLTIPTFFFFKGQESNLSVHFKKKKKNQLSASFDPSNYLQRSPLSTTGTYLTDCTLFRAFSFTRDARALCTHPRNLFIVLALSSFQCIRPSQAIPSRTQGLKHHLCVDDSLNEISSLHLPPELQAQSQPLRHISARMSNKHFKLNPYLYH